MKKFVGKIKGRGFFAGCETKPYSVRRPQEDIDAEDLNAKVRGWTWYVTCKTTTRYRMDIICKRNASDIPKEFICETKRQLKELIKTIENDNSMHGLDFSKIEIVELEADDKQKRVLQSKKKHFYTDQILKISHKTQSKKVIFCGNCGTNIYADEPRMYSNNAVICIHCLKTLGDTINDLYEKVPDKYKDDYLLARSVDI